MNKMRIQIGIALLVLINLLLLAGVALADSPGYTLNWWTVDGGGGTWSDIGGQYVLNGTVGQPDARVWDNGDYILVGGFWGGAVAEYQVYLPLVLSGSP